MQYEIRLAGPNDLDGIMRVFIEVAGERPVSISTPQEMEARRNVIENNLYLSDDPDFIWHAFVVDVEGEVVGVGDILKSSLARTGHVAEVGIGLRKGFRGMGLGRKLMKTMMEWLKGQDIKKVRLFVTDRNARAISLYKSLGFSVTGVYRDEVSCDNGFMDLLIMEKFL